MTEQTEKSPGSSDTPNKPVKAFSCVRCFERKVKCDKNHPCAGCVRSNVECHFRVPAPPRRKKKRTQEDILTERLNQYEQILQQKGINIDSVPATTEQTTPSILSERNGSAPLSDGAQPASTPSETNSRIFVKPKLIWDEGKARYTENNLWTRVAEEFRGSQDAIHESSDEEEDEMEMNEVDDNIDFTLGWTPSSTSVRNTHPPPEQISMLWQIYLDNVNPFSMILHRPTFNITLEKAMKNLEHLPRGIEALLFAIYSAAVMSMQDREAENTFGESRRTLLARYRTATKAALARAKFMGSSDINTLQAFVIHLLSMRDVYDGRTLWTLSGVALRIAEGMGMHRDGITLGLPPFRTEMRRRIWYQILTLDYRSAELSGSGKFKAADFANYRTKAPTNVNDSDIWPEMTEMPTPREKITDMALCCIRYEFSTYWIQRQSAKPHKPGIASLWENFHAQKSMEELDEAIDELEQLLETKYVRYCDPSIPTQLMTSLVARSAANTMRLMAHHPRRWATDDEIPESERKYLWKTCIRILEGYTMCFTSSALRRFNWHTSFYFQWQALIYLLDCVRADPTMPEADEAWKHIGDAFECHPNFISDQKKAIHFAVSGLCLKAYSAREHAFKREGRFLPARPPEYIQKLRRQREVAQAKQAERRAKMGARSTNLSEPLTSTTDDLVNMMGFEATPSTSVLQQPQLQQQQQLSLPQQQPLPPFQPPTDLTQPQGQQNVPFWFQSFETMRSSNPGGDMSWLMMQDPTSEQNFQMDWSQWDTLLNESGSGSAGFGNSIQQGWD